MKSKENLGVNIVTHAILAVMSAAAILPFLLLIVSSFTAQDEILLHGYSLFPRQFSLEAYNYLWRQRSQIFNAYGITILVTAFGTVLNVVITTLLAYPLSRSDLPGGRFLTFLVFFTMLFNGGLVPTYLIYTTYFGIKNTFAALLVPSLLMSPWYVLLSKSFFVNNVPAAVLESARIDGAHEFLVYRKIVMPDAVGHSVHEQHRPNGRSGGRSGHQDSQHHRPDGHCGHRIPSHYHHLSLCAEKLRQGHRRWRGERINLIKTEVLTL